MDQDGSRRIKSVERTHSIIEYLRKTDGARLSDIADAIGTTSSTVHPYLATLNVFGYVVQTGDKYRLGPELLTLGEYVRNHSRLYQAAKDEIDTCAEKTGEVVHLVIEHQGRGIALYERFGGEAIGTEFHETLRQQPHQHLHCTASGKAILAHLPEERVDAILEEHGLLPETESTITDKECLLEEFETIRNQGYAINDEEELLGIAAVGTPIRSQDGSVLGSLAISFPKSRMDQDDFRDHVIGLARRGANSIEVDLGTGQQ